MVDRARRFEADDLPAVDLAGLAELAGPERRRVDVAHPARDGGEAIGMGDVERRLGDRAIADARAVDEGLVGEIHQIVDDEPIIAFDGDELAVARPGRIVVPVQVGNLGGIGERRIARPYPDEAMTLDDGIGAHAGRGVDRLLRGHERAAAPRVERQPVVAADHLVALQAPQGQRQQAMPARVRQRGGGAVPTTIENDLLAAYRARQQLPPHLAVVGGSIPGVHGKWRSWRPSGFPPFCRCIPSVFLACQFSRCASAFPFGEGARRPRRRSAETGANLSFSRHSGGVRECAPPIVRRRRCAAQADARQSRPRFSGRAVYIDGAGAASAAPFLPFGEPCQEFMERGARAPFFCAGRSASAHSRPLRHSPHNLVVPAPCEP